MDVFLGGKGDLDFLLVTSLCCWQRAQGTLKMVSGGVELP